MCSRGHPSGLLGLPGGAQGAPKEALGGSIFVLDGLWGILAANLSARGPDYSPWGFIFVPFWGHFGVRAEVFFCCVFVSFR